jgi:glyoxylate reductase
MITDRIDDELMERAPELRMVANVEVGYDNIDLAAATARGIWVSNTPGVLTQATADLTWALILAAARRVVEGDRRTRDGKFKFFALLIFLGAEVIGKTLRIIGMGQIGKAVARRACGLCHADSLSPTSQARRSRGKRAQREVCKLGRAAGTG